MFLAALRHTLKIAVMLIAVNFALNLLFHYIGVERLSGTVLNRPVLGELILALFGLIPNCSVSVVVTESYLSGVLGLGGLFAGLLSNAGIGLLVLLRTNQNWKENAAVVAILYGFSVLAGIAVTLLAGLKKTEGDRASGTVSHFYTFIHRCSFGRRRTVIIDLQPRDKHVIDHERHVCQHKEHGQHGLSHALKVLHDSRQMEDIEHQAIGRKDRRVDIHELDRPRSRAHTQPADELSQHGIVAEEHEQHGRFLLRRQQRSQSGHGGVPQQAPSPSRARSRPG